MQQKCLSDSSLSAVSEKLTASGGIRDACHHSLSEQLHAIVVLDIRESVYGILTSGVLLLAFGEVPRFVWVVVAPR
jgi:hypothetical protein